MQQLMKKSIIVSREQLFFRFWTKKSKLDGNSYWDLATVFCSTIFSLMERRSGNLQPGLI